MIYKLVLSNSLKFFYGVLIILAGAMFMIPDAARA